MDFPAINFNLGLALATGGLVVGFIVGLTGVGGGSLMTPLLILVFGIKPHLAIGTDLLFAAITKSGALPGLARQKRIDWQVVGWLSAGSLPASVLTISAIERFGAGSQATTALSCHLLGVALILTAMSMFYKAWQSRKPAAPCATTALAVRSKSRQAAGCLALGLVLGCLVSLTSVGAGAIGTAALMLLFPAMPLARIVGNDIAHAVPLTLIGGLGHAWMGTVDWSMLAWLLAGSLPGIWLGTHSFQKLPEHAVRGGLSLLLAYAGSRLLLI